MTADPSAAADTLRDELARVLTDFWFDHPELGIVDECRAAADKALPVVRRYADAQVAAERRRILASFARGRP